MIVQFISLSSTLRKNNCIAKFNSFLISLKTSAIFFHLIVKENFFSEISDAKNVEVNNCVNNLTALCGASVSLNSKTFFFVEFIIAALVFF